MECASTRGILQIYRFPLWKPHLCAVACWETERGDCESWLEDGWNKLYKSMHKCAVLFPRNKNRISFTLPPPRVVCCVVLLLLFLFIYFAFRNTFLFGAHVSPVSSQTHFIWSGGWTILFSKVEVLQQSVNISHSSSSEGNQDCWCKLVRSRFHI